MLQLLHLARSLSLTSTFWSTLLLVATGTTARKELIYDVSFFTVSCYWLLQVSRVQQVTTSLAVLSDFESSLPLLITGLNHVKICLSSWFHIMPKLLLRSYFQHIAIQYCQKQDLDFISHSNKVTKSQHNRRWQRRLVICLKNFTFKA